MSAEHAFETLKAFFTTRQAARQALAAIDDGVEISVVIDHSVECAVFREGDQPMVERRAARLPDVVFHIRPETVYVLADRTKDEISDIGVNIFKEILAGNIQVKVPGRLFNIVRHGYLDMLKQGGAPLTAMLSRYGMATVPKIVNVISRLKR